LPKIVKNQLEQSRQLLEQARSLKGIAAKLPDTEAKTQLLSAVNGLVDIANKLSSNAQVTVESTNHTTAALATLGVTHGWTRN
jgi:hypothetical protein